MVAGQTGNNIIEQVQTNAIYNTSPIVELILYFSYGAGQSPRVISTTFGGQKAAKEYESDYNSE